VSNQQSDSPKKLPQFSMARLLVTVVSIALVSWAMTSFRNITGHSWWIAGSLWTLLAVALSLPTLFGSRKDALTACGVLYPFALSMGIAPWTVFVVLPVTLAIGLGIETMMKTSRADTP